MPLFATIDHLMYKNSPEKLLTLTMGDKHCLNFNSKIILYTLLATTDPHSVPPENHVILTKIILPVPPLSLDEMKSYRLRSIMKERK